MKSLIFISVILLSGSQTFARSYSSGIALNASGMYLINNTSNGTTNTNTNTNRSLADGVLGYRFSSPIFLGGIYGYDSNSSTTTGSLPSTSTDTFTSYGVTAGFDNGNLFLLGSYFIGSEYDSTTNSIKTAYTGGSGFQASLGYRFNVSSHFAIGPQFSYRSLSYTTQQVGSAPSTSVNYTATALLPYINFTYTFGGSSSDD